MRLWHLERVTRKYPQSHIMGDIEVRKFAQFTNGLWQQDQVVVGEVEFAEILEVVDGLG